MILQQRQMSKDAQYVNITFPLVCLSVWLARPQAIHSTSLFSDASNSY